jgi:drug/metabolite transporter (DMT)-like permease
VSADALAIIYALGASLGWGLSSLFVRLGVPHISTAQGTLVSMIVGLLMTSALVLLLQPADASELTLAGAGAFALVGILNFPFGRFMNYLSIQHLGVGRSTPIVAASPLFGMVFAVSFAGESLTFPVALGTALVLGGIYLTLGSGPEPGTSE